MNVIRQRVPLGRGQKKPLGQEPPANSCLQSVKLIRGMSGEAVLKICSSHTFKSTIKTSLGRDVCWNCGLNPSYLPYNWDLNCVLGKTWKQKGVLCFVALSRQAKVDWWKVSWDLMKEFCAPYIVCTSFYSEIILCNSPLKTRDLVQIDVLGVEEALVSAERCTRGLCS